MSGTGLKRPDAQNLLGRFLFSGWDEHEKPVAVLSGGERRRLALAIVVASGANFLVLDEPTNHLDLESRESLEIALEAFPGTVLLVSHDRALLDAVADRLLAVEDQRIVSFPGGWADYARAQAEDAAPAPASRRPRRSRRRAKPRRPAKPKPTALELVELEVARAEERVAELEQRLARDWGDVALLAAHRDARDDLAALLERWESVFEEAQAPLQNDATARIDSSVIGSSTRIASSAPAAASAPDARRGDQRASPRRRAAARRRRRRPRRARRRCARAPPGSRPARSAAAEIVGVVPREPLGACCRTA